MDRDTNLRVCAQHFRGNLDYVDENEEVTGDERILLGLRVYNAGPFGLTSDYASKYPANLAGYERALAWAHSQVGEGDDAPPSAADRAPLDALYTAEEACRPVYPDPRALAALDEVIRQIDVIKGVYGFQP